MASPIKKIVYTGLTVAFGFVAVVGYKKFKELQALQLLKVLPAKPSLTIQDISGGVAKVFINVFIQNPTQYNYTVKNFKASMNQQNKSGAVLGTFGVNTLTVAANADTLLQMATEIKLEQLLELAKNIFFTDKADIFLSGAVTYVSHGVSVPLPFSFLVDARAEFQKLLTR